MKIYNTTQDCDDIDLFPTLDQEAQRHGYADYQDYIREYMEGHTGGELGEPGCPDFDDSCECDCKSSEYVEGFSDGYEEGYDDGYSDGWSDCEDLYDSFDDCAW